MCETSHDDELHTDILETNISEKLGLLLSLLQGNSEEIHECSPLNPRTEKMFADQSLCAVLFKSCTKTQRRIRHQ